MKKAEAISILATSVRPREAKDRARYDEAVKMAIEALKQPERTQERTETHACDLIDRQAAVDAIYHHFPSVSRTRARTMLHEVPSAQPEPLSDAYTKAVWTWLLDYQIKAAKLKGRYTPYEVLSWVANDWRKEHEGSD